MRSIFFWFSLLWFLIGYVLGATYTLDPMFKIIGG
jgi:hypothetical protein